VIAGKAIARLVVRHATGIVVRGRELAQLLDVRVPWVEIPDGVDLDRFTPPPDDAAQRALGFAPGMLVAGVIGAVGTARRRGLGYGWDLVEALAATDPGVGGLVVGGGAGLDQLQRRASELGVADRVVFTGRVDHGRIPQLIGAMDVCISTQTNDAVGRARTTAKLPEYLACDRFVLATDVGGASDVLPAEMRIPYAGSWDPAYPERLAARLDALVPRHEELRRGVGTRELAARYAYPVLGRRLADFLAELASS
jgi:glycosyltransferase involved in cell wall biosynthesis